MKNDNGEFTEDPLGKANILNDYFSSVFTRENPSNIPDVHDRNYSASLEHIYIDQDIVKRYLLQLKPGKSMGVDNIHPAILKNLSEVFAKPLTEIFQTSIESGRLPCDWKDACVTPLFKKGSKTEPGNYRPVSLTSIVCTVMEKIIRKHIIDHLDYRKNSKNWDTLNYYRDCPTNGIVGFYSAILRSKDAYRITNRVDTDQTAP